MAVISAGPANTLIARTISAAGLTISPVAAIREGLGPRILLVYPSIGSLPPTQGQLWPRGYK